jgi:hypothetical protein
MRTPFVVTIVLALCLQAQAGAYERNCVTCHEGLDVGIDKFFYRYVLVFSSELSTKAALKDYLMYPMKEKSLLPEGLLEKYGVKAPSILSEPELEEAIDVYWKRYTFIGRLE